MKTLLIGLLVVIVLLLPSCTSQEDLQLAWNDGFQAGADEGYQIGYDNGYSDGSDAGYDTGYDEGYNEGHDDAFQDFWDAFAQAYDEYIEDGETITGWEDLIRIYGGEVEGEAEDNLYLIITSITPQAYPGDYATLKAQTIPGALCTISVSYLIGMDEPQGLEDKYADDEGNVSWRWKVGEVMMGRYPITVRSFDLSDPRTPSVYRTAYLIVKTEF